MMFKSAKNMMGGQRNSFTDASDGISMNDDCEPKGIEGDD